MSCVFCTDPSRAGDVVYEDERTWVVLHEDWSPRGHAMVVSKQHVENASDLDEQAWLHLAHVWQRAEGVLLEATRMQRAIIVKLGIATPHLHVHIYPVSAETSREEVFAYIDGRKRDARDQEFVRHLTLRLR
jgi:diadenosine tetraphosphate (Ap4A) HIT family hydrolase